MFWNFKIRNNVWITKGSDNADSDNRGSTVSLPNSGGTLVTQLSASPRPMTLTSHSDVLYTHILSEYHLFLLKHSV